MPIQVRIAGLTVMAALLIAVFTAAYVVDPTESRREILAALNEAFSLSAEEDKRIKQEGAISARVEGGVVMPVAKGTALLVSTSSYDIDPSKRYKVMARLRVLNDDPDAEGAVTLVGVATYDKNGKLLKSGVGAHRYAAWRNRLLTVSDGWVVAEGEIGGFGDTRHNQFRPGTTSVRPLVLLNYHNEEAVTIVGSIGFEEIGEQPAE